MCEVILVHSVHDPALTGLHAVADVGECAGGNYRHRVFDKGFFDFLFDTDIDYFLIFKSYIVAVMFHDSCLSFRFFLLIIICYRFYCFLSFLSFGDYFVFVRRVCIFDYFEAAKAKESWGGGGENTDLSRRESRYLDCEAKRSKTNLWLL